MAPSFSHTFRNETDEGLFVDFIVKGILLITQSPSEISPSEVFQIMMWMGMADGMEVTLHS